MENIFKVPDDLVRPPTDLHKKTVIEDVDAVDSALRTRFEFNEQLNRRIFNQPSISMEKKNQLESKVLFELPVFVIQLKRDSDPLVEIFFRDFNVSYEKNDLYETNIQVSLRSVLMEDLLQPPESKHRSMVISSSPDSQAFRPCSTFSSRSCPNLAELHNLNDHVSGSLPEILECGTGYRVPQTAVNANQNKPNCPETPPPSPQQRQRQDNLVLYSLLMVDPECPTFSTQYNSIHQSSSIDFNSLNLIISVQSWIVFLNFFGLLSDENESTTGYQEVEKYSMESDRTRNDRNSELEISVRSLTLVFIRTDYEIAKANVSNARFVVSRMGSSKTVEGKLGSISLIDLTVHGSIYRERFLTDGNEALNFIFRQCGQPKISGRSLASDGKLTIRMSSVRYVHTKRFVAEIQAFFKEFQQLQTPVLRRIKPSDSKSNLQQRPTQLELDIKAGSPIILLPLSSGSEKVIVADLGEFSLTNSFHYACEPKCISVKSDPDGVDEILDVMHVDLVNTDLFAGLRRCKDEAKSGDVTDFCMDMGTYLILKKGANLLNDKCQLKLIVERNMDSWKTQNTPDFSVQGTLSKLEAVLNLQQYQLIRGFLSYNLGESIDDLFVEDVTSFANSRSSILSDPVHKNQASYVWTNISITLDLQDVSVRLQVPCIEPGLLGHSDFDYLACINFIKSSLKIDLFSDGTQDIDLVSKEILVIDSRFMKSSAPKNIFSNILQPVNFAVGTDDSVQAEVHCRKRKDASKYTILLNNMRLIAILDWLESVQDFLAQNADEPQMLKVSLTVASDMHDSVASPVPSEPFEVILNITDSELVFVETPDQSDSKAVILKSTTVVSYRPLEVDKVMSINLNHLEVFSCVMGFEEETALSIIDPVTINLDIKRNTLDIQLQKRLYIRLSYNDSKMFMQMFQSLPQQTKTAKNRVQAKKDIHIDEGKIAVSF